MSVISYFLSLGPAVILLGAILAAVGGFLAAIKNNQDQVLLRNKAEQIAKLNEEMLGMTTGRGSVPYVQPFLNVSTDTVTLDLLTEGKYPVHNIKLTINDHYKASQLLAHSKPKSVDPKFWIKNWDIGTVFPSTASHGFYSFPLKIGEGPVKLSCWILALNGNFFQSFIISRGEKGLTVKSELSKDNKVIKSFENSEHP